MFLITGATGNIGAHLINNLTTSKSKVRAVSRSPFSVSTRTERVDVVTADLQSDDTDFEHLFDGVTGLFLNSSATMGRTADFLSAAKTAEVKHVVLVSSVYVQDGVASAAQRDAIAGMHRSMEEATEQSGITWTHLRAEEFATNTLFQFVPQISQGDVVRGAFADAASATIHERDIADSAAAVLRTGPETHARKTYILTGPDTITERGRVDVIAKATGRALRFEQIPPREALRIMVSSYVPEPIAHAALVELEHRLGNPPIATRDVQTLTGRPALSYAQWVDDHIADLRVR